MPRAIFKFTNGDYLNIQADLIGRKDGDIEAWNGDNLVAMAKAELVDICYLTEKKEGANNG